MDYIYSKLDTHLVDINQIEYITLKVCSINGEPLEVLQAGDYYLETKIVDSDKLIYTNLAPINRNNTSVLTKLEQEIQDRINQGNTLQTNIDNEAKRTDNMINQLNENVHSQLTQLNKILVDSINTINGGIEEERKIREEADNTLQSNLDKESKRVDSMINQVNVNIKVIVDQLNKNIVKFGPVKRSSGPQTQWFELCNVGQEPLTVRAVECNVFSCSLQPGTSVAPGGRIEVAIRFDPAQCEYGVAVERLRIVTDDPQHPLSTVRATAVVEM